MESDIILITPNKIITQKIELSEKAKKELKEIKTKLNFPDWIDKVRA